MDVPVVGALRNPGETETAKGKENAPNYVGGKPRQLWRNDCRESSPEVVFLKQTSPRNRRAGDWMVDNILEGAMSKLNPSGQGRVRVLVEAFESLMNLGENNMRERRASRVWCLNRMEKGEVDEDGEECEEGDQRVDCYEVSGDGLQLRASMRLSLGGGNRHAICSPDEVNDNEMSAIQKVHDWDDCHRSTSSPNFERSFEDQDHSCLRSQSSGDGEVVGEEEESKDDQYAELTIEEYQRRMSNAVSSAWHANLNENHRCSGEFNCDGTTHRLFVSSTEDNEKQKTDDPDTHYKYQGPRQRRFWKAGSVKSEAESPSPSYRENVEKNERIIKGTLLAPFRLLTEERGAIKEHQFAQKLQQMFAEEVRLRTPVAQGLPWTTDEPQVVPKPPVKEQTRPAEFKHYSNSRAMERAEFDNYVADRIAYLEMQRQEEERLRQMAELDEIKRLRREMVPRAQLMPFFDQPFMPTRSSKRLTVPKEPSFHNRDHKRAKCMVLAGTSVRGGH